MNSGRRPLTSSSHAEGGLYRHFRAARLSVTIRFLDPPLHEFYPTIREINNIAESMGMTFDDSSMLISLHELNPMMGTGAAVGFLPEIYEMQTKAVATALEVNKTTVLIEPEIMIPCGRANELKFVKGCHQTADRLIAKQESSSTTKWAPY